MPVRIAQRNWPDLRALCVGTQRESSRTAKLSRSAWWIPAGPAATIPVHSTFRRPRLSSRQRRARAWQSTETALQVRSVEARMCWKRSEFESTCRSSKSGERYAKFEWGFYLRKMRRLYRGIAYLPEIKL